MSIFKRERIVPYTPTSDTLFYITNDGEISDHSQYNHTMNWYWTQGFSTLSSWVKVADFTWSNAIYSDRFEESKWISTFTMHIWVKLKSSSTTSDEKCFWWWMWRAPDSTTTDRWWIKWQRSASTNPFYIIYWTSSTTRQQSTTWQITPSTTQFDLFTVTANWWTIVTYKNWAQIWTWSWSTLNWWNSTSVTGTHFSLWWSTSDDNWTISLWQLIGCYIWESILEKKVETVSEIQEYYNKSKILYQS